MKSLAARKVIFSVYPFTAEYKDNIEKNIPFQYEYIDLSTVRKSGAVKTVLFFIRLKCDHLLLAHEASESKELMSVLTALSLFSRAKKIYGLNEKLEWERISRLSISKSLLQIIGATISGIFVLFNAVISIKVCKRRAKTIPMREDISSILYLNLNLWYGVKVGGSVGHIAGVANDFDKRGYSVSYAAISDSSSLRGSIRRLLLKSPTSFGLPPEINSYRFDQHNYNILLKAIATIKPSFIYQRLSVCSYIGAKLSQKLRIPLIVEYNGSEVWIAKNWGRPLVFHKTAKNAEDLMLKAANVVVTISNVLRDELIERGVPPEKIACYPNCIDPDFFDPNRFSIEEKMSLRKKIGVFEDTRLLTFLGTFGQWHGVDVLAKGICELVKFNSEFLDKYKVKFLLIGDGLKMMDVRNILHAGNAEHYCLLTGLIPQQEAPYYLAVSDILISPHVRNPDGTPFFGSPTKLFEYLAIGKPIIASDLDQIGEVLHNSIKTSVVESIENVKANKRVAVLIEPGNASELVSAIKMLVEDTELQSILGENSRNLALEKYTWNRHVKEILNTLQKS